MAKLKIDKNRNNFSLVKFWDLNPESNPLLRGIVAIFKIFNRDAHAGFWRKYKTPKIMPKIRAPKIVEYLGKYTFLGWGS
jgi:hypothetical protein